MQMRIKRTLLILAAILLALTVWTYGRVAGSLPELDGETVLDGLQSAVRVERDAGGVATIRGDNRIDVARSLGFVHAQERFFQMDLMRRAAAGELSALLGAGALPIDRQTREHRMRHRAKRVVSATRGNELEVLNAYVEGINSGLAALDAPPFEYLLLRQEPAPWSPEDSVLVIMSMFFQLHDPTGRREAGRALLYDTLPRDMAEFLTPDGTEWDAPVQGEPFETAPFPEGPVPPQEVAARDAGGQRESDRDGGGAVGSNNWAVAGARTRHGGALLANDMHLGHAVPNIWFRALLEWDAHRVVGVTLPGTPSLVVGSNGHIAWGFTNTNGDWTDLIEVELDPSNPDRYRTDDGWQTFAVHRERIDVRAGEPEFLEVRETIWGPLVDENHRGQPIAARWIAHEVDAVNLELGRLETVQTLADALFVAADAGIPPQNFVCVDREGSIAWTVAGAIPKRVGFDGALPTSWSDGSRRWDGFLAAEEHPRIVDPPDGVIWTANARVVGGEALAILGDGGYALGARAAQIRDGLLALERGGATEKDMLAIQLDDRALFLERWRTLFLEVLRDRDDLADVRRYIDEGWTGHASIDSVGYRMVTELREAVANRVLGVLTAPAAKADERFRIVAVRQREGPLWKLVSARPAHLVPPPFATWEEALAEIVAAEVDGWEPPLAERTWGEANTSDIQHPLSRAVPALARWIDMPKRALPGDIDMPRVQGPADGASERLVVSPGREEQGLFHMPGGQSGHPLSPYYGAGHGDWEEGRATPLLPGSARWTLTLTPSG